MRTCVSMPLNQKINTRQGIGGPGCVMSKLVSGCGPTTRRFAAALSTAFSYNLMTLKHHHRGFLFIRHPTLLVTQWY